MTCSKAPILRVGWVAPLGESRAYGGWLFDAPHALPAIESGKTIVYGYTLDELAEISARYMEWSDTKEWAPDLT